MLPNRIKLIYYAIGIFVGIVTIIAAVLTIRAFLISPYKIEAYALTVEAPMPPNLREELENLHVFSVEEITRKYSQKEDFPMVSNEIIEEAIPLFSEIIKDRLYWSLRQGGLSDDHLGVILIRNIGDKTARDVQFQMGMPAHKPAVIERNFGIKEVVDFGGVLKLGDMPPKSTIKIYLYQSLIFFGASVVTHDEGFTDVSVYSHPSPHYATRSKGIYIQYKDLIFLTIFIIIIGIIFPTILLKWKNVYHSLSKDSTKE